MHTINRPILSAAAFAALTLAGCHHSSNNNGAPPATGFGITNAFVAASATNALSAIVSFEADNALTASVSYVVSGSNNAPLISDPQPVTAGINQILLLGLEPTSRYDITLTVKGAEDKTEELELVFDSGILPPGLRTRVRIATAGDGTPGYVFTGLLSPDPDFDYVIAFDNGGRIVWYAPVPELGTYTGILDNGNHSAFIGTSTGWQPTFGYFLEVTAAGQIIGRVNSPTPLYADNHELLVTSSGGQTFSHLLTYDIRPTDLSPMNGNPNCLLAGHQIVRYSDNGQVDFFWNAWDHFELADWIEEPRTDLLRPNTDFDHPNSLRLDDDGHYLVSFRSMAQVVKIDSKTGRIIWRLGGRANDFFMQRDTLGGFNGQHDVQRLPNGNIILFDNGLRHRPPESRVVEYHLDEENKVATQVWEYRHNPAVYTPFVGSVQRFGNGNTLAGFGLGGLAVESDADGVEVWQAKIEVDGNSIAVYRFIKTTSLLNGTKP